MQEGTVSTTCNNAAQVLDSAPQRVVRQPSVETFSVNSPPRPTLVRKRPNRFANFSNDGSKNDSKSSSKRSLANLKSWRSGAKLDISSSEGGTNLDINTSDRSLNEPAKKRNSLRLHNLSSFRSKSRRSSGASLMSSLSTVFSFGSMRSMILFSTEDLDEDDELKLNISSPNNNSQSDTDDIFETNPNNSQSDANICETTPPRFPWRQTSVKSGSCPMMDHQTLETSSKDEKERGKSSMEEKKSLLDTSSMELERSRESSSEKKRGFKFFPSKRQQQSFHIPCSKDRDALMRSSASTSATFRMSASSGDCPLFALSSEIRPNDSRQELPFPVREESNPSLTSKSHNKASLPPNATKLEKKSFLKRQLQFPKQRLGQTLKRVVQRNSRPHSV